LIVSPSPNGMIRAPLAAERLASFLRPVFLGWIKVPPARPSAWWRKRNRISFGKNLPHAGADSGRISLVGGSEMMTFAPSPRGGIFRRLGSWLARGAVRRSAPIGSCQPVWPVGNLAWSCFQPSSRSLGRPLLASRTGSRPLPRQRKGPTHRPGPGGTFLGDDTRSLYPTIRTARRGSETRPSFTGRWSGTPGARPSAVAVPFRNFAHEGKLHAGDRKAVAHRRSFFRSVFPTWSARALWPA